MAVILAEEYESSGGGGRKTSERSWTVIYRVITDSRRDGAKTACGGAPAYNSTYAYGDETDTGVRLNDKTAQLAEGAGTSRKVWFVTCKYSDDAKSCSEDAYESPLDEPPQISMGTAIFSKIMEKDTEGTAFVNSAKQAFDPPREFDDPRPVVRLVINISKAAYDEDVLYEYLNCLNDASFWGLSAGKVKFSNFDAERKFLGTCTEFYWTVSFEFQINFTGFDEEILDQGFAERVDGELRTLYDDTPVAEGGPRPLNFPALLNGVGRKLPDGDPEVYLTRKPYFRKAFSALVSMGVPNPLYS